MTRTLQSFWNTIDSVQKALDLKIPTTNRIKMSIMDLNFQIKKLISLASRLVWNWPSKLTTHSLVFCEMWMSKWLQCVWAASFPDTTNTFLKSIAQNLVSWLFSLPSSRSWFGLPTEFKSILLVILQSNPIISNCFLLEKFSLPSFKILTRALLLIHNSVCNVTWLSSHYLQNSHLQIRFFFLFFPGSIKIRQLC